MFSTINIAELGLENMKELRNIVALCIITHQFQVHPVRHYL